MSPESLQHAKRRRIDEALVTSESIAMTSDERNLLSSRRRGPAKALSDPYGDMEVDHKPGENNEQNDNEADRAVEVDGDSVHEKADAKESETPSRTLRTSERQRKAPKRYAPSPERSQELMLTPSRRGRRTATKSSSSMGNVANGTRSSKHRAPAKADEHSESKINTEVEGVAEADMAAEDILAANGILPSVQLQEREQEHNGDLNDVEIESNMPSYVTQFVSICESEQLHQSLASLLQLALEKLNGQRPIPLCGLDQEYEAVYHLLEQTVLAGEGNSMLVLGSRGCGKTAIIDRSLSELAKDHSDDFHIVRLNGFLQTDDRLALCEIWRQLGREMQAEDVMNQVTSYSDTMTSLLALLSHPEELYGVPEDSDAIRTAKSVIIILDEFELFAYHPRQTLLYNLFDIAQARKAPLAVLGLTTKVNIMEHLEKRVKSRYSHRYCFVPRPQSFETFMNVCKAALRLTDEELVPSPDSDSVSIRELQGSKASILMDGWNEYLDGLFRDPAFQDHLKEIHFQTNSPRDFFTSALIPLSTLYHSIQSQLPSSQPIRHASIPIPIPIPSSFTANPLSCPDPPPLPLPLAINPTTISTTSLPLPLSLLLAATRLAAIHDPALSLPKRSTAPTSSSTSLTLSFSTAYAEYVRLLTTAKASASAAGAAVTAGRVWGRDVAREAWEKLVAWGLVMPVGGGGGGGSVMGLGMAGGGDGCLCRLEVSFEEVMSEIGQVGTGTLGRWWRER